VLLTAYRCYKAAPPKPALAAAAAALAQALDLAYFSTGPLGFGAS